MLRRTWLFIFTSLLLGIPTAFGQTANSQFKQLAGPAEEIEGMRLPSPHSLGQRSKSAMIPIRNVGADGVWRIVLPVEKANDVNLQLLAPNSESWTVKLSLPGSASFDLRADSANRGITRQFGAVGLEGESFPAEVYAIEETQAGFLTLELTIPAGKRQSVNLGYVVISSRTPFRLYSHLNTNQTIVGRKLGLATRLFNNESASESGAPTALTGISEANASIQDPTGVISSYKMFDDGLHNDQNAADGVYGTEFVPDKPGRFIAQITASGIAPSGDKFIRTTEHLIQVVGNKVTAGRQVAVSSLDNSRWRLELPVVGLKAGEKVLGYAEVWGRNSNGEAKPIAWIGGLTLTEVKEKSGAQVVPFTLDSRWVSLKEAFDTYELRNLRLQDSDYFVPVLEVPVLDLPALPKTSVGRTLIRQITEEMRTGPRPNISTNAPGGKLMLVHGYCSGSNPWPATQFANSVVFNDLNQNRTHDQFANLIRNFGASLPSFGVVAHSQGGAAALHLYTYYWSGLDNATGTRLIQSVGTPYQGTALAGNLALLGQIFGAGCGSNSNLSYSGAAAWLAGIPTWARAKVFYSTTSFTDVWWRYDYCSLATDAFLSDPEDGVVEQSKGQLPGATNRGHKTGWCHTSGMRDPAQTSDSVRNSDMNLNAAR